MTTPFTPDPGRSSPPSAPAHTPVPSSTSSANSTAPVPAELPCPACGYDLRALASPQCPECGLPVTPELLADPKIIPWLYRDELGRVRAFTRTVRLVVRRPWKLHTATLRPVDLRESRRFAAWCTLPIALASGLAVGLFLGLAKPVPSPSPWLSVPYPDLLIPLGRTIHGFLPYTGALFTAALLWLLPRAGLTPFALLREHRRPTERALRAAALVPYTAAILPFLFAAALPFVVVMLITVALDAEPGKNTPATLALGLTWVAFLLAAAWSAFVLLLTPTLLLRRAGASWLLTFTGLLLHLLTLAAALLTLALLCFWLPGYLHLVWEVTTK